MLDKVPTVETMEELKDKATILDGNIYDNDMLIFVREKKSIYKAIETDKHGNKLK